MEQVAVSNIANVGVAAGGGNLFQSCLKT